MNDKVVTIAMEPIIIVIPLLFEEEKMVYLRTLLDFVFLLGFILENEFMKVEKGNMQRGEGNDEERVAVGQ